jgi:site-specific DNA recombinase
MIKVIGYARVSTEDQANKGVSLDAQIDKIKAYASLYDLELVDIKVDAGKSAKTLEREGLKECLEMLNNGTVQGVIVFKLDRLTRKVADLNYLLENYFNQYILYSVSEQIDTSSASGRLILNVLMSVSQWEVETISERTKVALNYKKELGEHCGGVGLGYTITNKKLTKAQNYKTIETILEMRKKGLSMAKIASILNNKGIETARGGAWYSSTVKAILDREVKYA